MATDPVVIEEFRLDLETEVNIKISAIFVYFTREIQYCSILNKNFIFFLLIFSGTY